MRHSNIHARQGRTRRDKARQENAEPVSPVTEVADRGNYHNDYSPRYTGAYDIYEKARNHVKALRQSRRRDLEQDPGKTGNENP